MTHRLQRYDCVLPLALPRLLTYWGDALQEGQVMLAPVGKKTMPALVWRAGNPHLPAQKIKPLSPPPHAWCLSPAHLTFLRFMADYTLTPPNMLWRMVLGGAALPTFSESLATQADAPHVPQLSDAQKKAIQPVLNDLAQHTPRVTLLEGVTGSGKTETFCEAIDACMASGQQALVLLPEISLTISLLQRFAARFGFMPTLWHSGLTPKQRRTRWWDIQQGTARLIVGARSALLLPYARLGLVVVDEEHDAGYKQDDSVLYQARDMAVARAHHEHIPIILSSATPSLEARHHARQKKYRHVVLPQRFGGAVLPDMALIDLRKEKLPAQSWLSVPARHEIAETHGRGEQSLIFINRRGYAPLTLCRACGARLQCPYCSAWLVQHKKNDRLQCHHCGHEKNLPPACHDCGAIDSWAHSGPGIERVAEECEKIFPHLRRCVISSDLVSAREMARLFADIAEHRVDIIIGTQLTTKGHHFPKLTTVVVVDADSGLTGADPRAGERSWQMLQQVAGRSGRDRARGKAWLQTYQPDHPVLKALAAGDHEKFLQAEMAERETYTLPPFMRLAALIIHTKQQAEGYRLGLEMAEDLSHNADLSVLGPAPAPLLKLRGWFRHRLLLKSGKAWALQHAMKPWHDKLQRSRTCKVLFDIDPYNFM